MIMKDGIVEISGREGLGVETLGGKASSLNRLVGQGFPVPRAYCVTVPAYEAFLAQTGMDGWIREQGRLDAKARLAVRERIEASPIPGALAQAVAGAYAALGGGRVAVRSSGIEEDGASSSFAGQYDTFLHVEGEEAVIDAVKRCWGSLWAGRSEAYQARRDDAGAGGSAPRGIAVLIQEMVDADAAGVLFTADPLDGDPARIVIESCWGLGEGVVSGQVVTDTFVVDAARLEVVDGATRHKPVMSARAGTGGVQLEEVPDAKAAAPSLTHAQAVELARCAGAIKAAYGRELDIEWAVAGGGIHILQARPITTVPGARAGTAIYADAEETDPFIRDNAMFSRMDTGEIVTGCMSPLGLSFCRFYQQNIHGPAVKPMGLRDIGNPQHYMGYIQGYVYLNISASAHLLTQCPPTRNPMKFTKRYATDEVDLSSYRNPYGEPSGVAAYLGSSLYWLGYQIHNLLTARRTVREMVALRERETERFLKLDLRSMSLQELDAELSRIDRNFLTACAAYMPFFLQSFALYDALSELCGKWLRNEGGGLQNRIKASLNNLRTIEVTRGICRLAERVDRSPSLKALFLDVPAERIEDALRDDPEGRRFRDEDFAGFLKEFGSRGRQEFDLSIPRWNDDPTYLLQVIRMYLTNDVRLEERLAETDARREEETRTLLSKLPRKARMAIGFVISTYGTMAERREATRPTFIAQTWFYRKIIVEILRRLEEQDIAGIRDLPYVDFNELRDYVAGRKSAGEAFRRELLEVNRRQHLINLRAAEPPMSIIGGHVPRRESALADDGDGTLRGLAASPGVTVGRARVITDLARQADELQQGEILVAKFTDASWTPLFVLAAGIVADIGSPLSHSSIVSREFGIPAVVNTKHGTQLIRTGDLIYLDGDAGLVRIEERMQLRAA
jgi:prodigiosin/undecylprodigiosin synthetase